jgi:hypothetical protein
VVEEQQKILKHLEKKQRTPRLTYMTARIGGNTTPTGITRNVGWGRGQEGQMRSRTTAMCLQEDRGRL